MSPAGFAMSLTPSLRFFRGFLARPAAPDADDPADMGTAFGLEASLGPVSAYPADAAARAANSADEDDSPMGWLGRRLKR